MFRRWLASLIASFVLVSLAIAAPPGQESGGGDPQIQSFADVVRKYPAHAQAEKITSLAEQGMVFSEETLPEAFDLLQSGKALHIYMDAFEEPLSSTRIAALERLVSSSKDESARFRAAALLLRYDRQPGLDFIVARARDESDYMAAELLAMAQVEGFEGTIIEAVHVQSSQGRQRIFDSLQRWESGALNQALQGGLATDSKRNIWYLMSLSGEVDADSRDALVDAFTRWKSSVEAGTDTTMDLKAAAALSRIDPPDPRAEQYLAERVQTLATYDRPWNALAVIESAASSGNPELIGELERLIRRLLSNWQEQKTGELNTRREIVGAALAELVRADVDLDPGLMASMVGLFRGAHLQPTMLAVLAATGDPIAMALVEATVGVDEAARIRQIAKLNPVPREYLPIESRKWAWR